MSKALIATLAVTIGAAGLSGLAYTVTQEEPVAAIAGQFSTAASNPAAPGQTKKSPTASPPPKSLELTPTPMIIEGLAPGVSVNKTLTVFNSNNQDVVLQSVTASVFGASPAPESDLGCYSPRDFVVELTSPGKVTIVKKDDVEVPVVIRMINSATRNQDSCKGKSFSFTFTATATSK